MSKQLSEKQVLKKLNVSDFGSLSKDNLIEMASMLGKMDPEVVKKAVEMFPAFAQTTKDMLTEYSKTLNGAIASNDESVRAYNMACCARIASLQKELEKTSLTWEMKGKILTEMNDITEQMGRRDRENKRFLLRLASKGIGALVVVGITVAAVVEFGVNQIVDSVVVERKE